MGRQGLCPERGSVCSDFQAGEQAARQICRVRRVRGRVQIRPASQQLHVSWGLDVSYAAHTHVKRTVSTYNHSCKMATNQWMTNVPNHAIQVPYIHDYF